MTDFDDDGELRALAERLAAAIPLPAAVTLRCGDRFWINRPPPGWTAGDIWASVMRNAVNPEMGPLPRPTLADFEALLAHSHGETIDPWRALALDAVAWVRRMSAPDGPGDLHTLTSDEAQSELRLATDLLRRADRLVASQR